MMGRQSISFTSPNEAWMKAQVDSEEYASKSELVNDLIRRARENEIIRDRLIKAEQNGFIDKTANEMLLEFKAKAREDGEL